MWSASYTAPHSSDVGRAARTPAARASSAAGGRHDRRADRSRRILRETGVAFEQAGGRRLEAWRVGPAEVRRRNLRRARCRRLNETAYRDDADGGTVRIESGLSVARGHQEPKPRVPIILLDVLDETCVAWVVWLAEALAVRTKVPDSVAGLR